MASTNKRTEDGPGVDELGRRTPPPGWEYYFVTDDDGCQWPSANVRRTELEVMDVDAAWEELEKDARYRAGWAAARADICKTLRSNRPMCITQAQDDGMMADRIEAGQE